ncbi:hypothetical protein Pmani_010353 [Petrolisthes manimaculis]|uniref:Uncharacterized protein n=1 Tax=Petrolisthes manimaculis TaxID=1843537 RepID=A0AAE1Q3B7_9EUCA|nr:hypothetical protein Pmani_010353 [Petrolisthes manimaculis]
MSTYIRQATTVRPLTAAIPLLPDTGALLIRLLGFPPGPVHTSLDNLDAPDFPRVAILMPELSADTHSTWKEPLQDSLPSSHPSFRVAGLQNYATSPS